MVFRMKKGIKRTIVILLAAVAIVAVCSGLYVRHMSSPVGDAYMGSESVIVTVPQGAGTSAIASILEESKVIRSAFVFKLVSRVKGYDGSYKAGEYELSAYSDLEGIMKELKSGKSLASMITVPEGLSVEALIEKLVEEKRIDEENFRKQLSTGKFDYRFLEGIPEGDKRLEGFLYPETYAIGLNADDHEIIDIMLRQFDKVFTSEMYDRAAELGYSVREIVTVASLIERESGNDDERAKIASVIYNRLKKGQRLQIDATVQYALGKTKARLYAKDLKVKSPYNTYLNAGLPPTPICSPSIASIKAALYPADTDYYYYVLKNKNSNAHNFAKDYDTFLEYKDAYIKSLD